MAGRTRGSRRDARIPGDRGAGELPPADRRLEDQRDRERFDRRRLLHPHRYREEPAPRGSTSRRTRAGHMSRDRGPAGMRGALVIMAKAPRKGFVKTRLAAASPPCDVVQLSECMLHDTLTLAQSLAQVHVAVMCPSEEVADVSARLPPGLHVVGQDGKGLAAALASVFRFFVADFSWKWPRRAGTPTRALRPDLCHPARPRAGRVAAAPRRQP